jgi:hypothetical protein
VSILANLLRANGVDEAALPWEGQRAAGADAVLADLVDVGAFVAAFEAIAVLGPIGPGPSPAS